MRRKFKGVKVATMNDNIINNLYDLLRDLEELALAFGRTGNSHVADQLHRMGKFLNENIEELTNNSN